MKIQIRQITEMDEINLILDLMQRVWQLHDREVVASFEMKAVSQFGILLGAYDTDKDPNKPIGFIYAFNKFPDVHYSHMMGIDPDYQGKNIGFNLKKFHRKLALQEKNPTITSIEWTVDPLLSINAQLNFRKLGVICNDYHENFYGTAVNVGLYPSLPTDRILVKWLIRSPRVEKHFQPNFSDKLPWNSPEEFQKKITIITKFEEPEKLLQAPAMQEFFTLRDQDPVAIEIPDNFTDLSRSNHDWALQWRLSLRFYFIELFKRKYFLVDYFSFKTTSLTRRNFYLFTRKVTNYEY